MQIIKKKLEHIGLMRIISQHFSTSNITQMIMHNDNMHNIITTHHTYLIIPNIVSTFHTKYEF